MPSYIASPSNPATCGLYTVEEHAEAEALKTDLAASQAREQWLAKRIAEEQCPIECFTDCKLKTHGDSMAPECIECWINSAAHWLKQVQEAADG